jgi:hypothetical protein
LNYICKLHWDQNSITKTELNHKLPVSEDTETHIKSIFNMTDVDKTGTYLPSCGVCSTKSRSDTTRNCTPNLTQFNPNCHNLTRNCTPNLTQFNPNCHNLTRNCTPNLTQFNPNCHNLTRNCTPNLTQFNPNCHNLTRNCTPNLTQFNPNCHNLTRNFLSGFVPQGEIKSLLRTLNIHLTPFEFSAILSECDMDYNGDIVIAQLVPVLVDLCATMQAGEVATSERRELELMAEKKAQTLELSLVFEVARCCRYIRTHVEVIMTSIEDPVEKAKAVKKVNPSVCIYILLSLYDALCREALAVFFKHFKHLP